MKFLMYGYDYWRRTLQSFLGAKMTLFVRGSDGKVRRFTGWLQSVEDPVGPVIAVNGGKFRIKGGWQELYRVEDAAQRPVRVA